MHRQDRDQLLSYRQRHLCGMRSAQPWCHLSDEQLLQRAHLRGLRATYRYNQRGQKNLRQGGRRLSDPREARWCQQGVQEVRRRRFQRSKRVCGIGGQGMQQHLLAQLRRSRASLQCHHLQPKLAGVARRRFQARPGRLRGLRR